MNSSYISFTSRDDKNPAKFKTKNSYQSLITDGNYEIALSQIKYPTQWKTFNDSKCYVREMFGFLLASDLEIPIPGAYIENIEGLVTYVNKIIREKFLEYEDELWVVAPMISYNYESKTFVQHSGYGDKSNFYILEFEGDLRDIFMFEEFPKMDMSKLDNFMTHDQWVTYKGNRMTWSDVPVADRTLEHVSDAMVLLNRSKKARYFEFKKLYAGYDDVYKIFHEYNSRKFDKTFKQVFQFKSKNISLMKPKHGEMFVCCNLVNPVVESTPITKLLRVVDIDNNEFSSRRGRKSYDDMVYVPITSTVKENIEITIVDENGKEFPFLDGLTRVALHIRRIPCIPQV